MPNRDWKVVAQLLFRHAEPVAQQARRLQTLAVIGVALIRYDFVHAVVGGENHLRLEVEPLEVALERGGERVDIDRIVMPVGRDAE